MVILKSFSLSLEAKGLAIELLFSKVVARFSGLLSSIYIVLRD